MKRKKKIPAARVMVRRVFICAGCGRRVVSDGTPRTKAYTWTDVKTGARRKYCCVCDDELIQGVM